MDPERASADDAGHGLYDCIPKESRLSDFCLSRDGYGGDRRIYLDCAVLLYIPAILADYAFTAAPVACRARCDSLFGGLCVVWTCFRYALCAVAGSDVPLEFRENDCVDCRRAALGCDARARKFGRVRFDISACASDSPRRSVCACRLISYLNRGTYPKIGYVPRFCIVWYRCLAVLWKILKLSGCQKARNMLQ